jgi:hypothetical protein
MAEESRIKMTSIETKALIPGVQVTLDLQQAALVRDLLGCSSPGAAKTKEEAALINTTYNIFRGVGGMDVSRHRLYLFGE